MVSQDGIWQLTISFIGSGEEAGRANDIIIAARRRGKRVYGEGPWWDVVYEDVETRGAAMAALSSDLDEIDPAWAEVLEVG